VFFAFFAVHSCFGSVRPRVRRTCIVLLLVGARHNGGVLSGVDVQLGPARLIRGFMFHPQWRGQEPRYRGEQQPELVLGQGESVGEEKHRWQQGGGQGEKGKSLGQTFHQCSSLGGPLQNPQAEEPRGLGFHRSQPLTARKESPLASLSVFGSALDLRR
jgi:hypothetical protein